MTFSQIQRLPFERQEVEFFHLLNPNCLIQASLTRTVLFTDFISTRHRSWEFRAPFKSPKLLDPIYITEAEVGVKKIPVQGYSTSYDNKS